MAKKKQRDDRNYKPGHPVRLGGVEYPTVIDTSGVRRFVQNEVVRYIIDEIHAGRKAGLNELIVAYHQDKFDQRSYAEFNMMLGYSVCGFQDLSCFGNMKFEDLDPEG